MSEPDMTYVIACEDGSYKVEMWSWLAAGGDNLTEVMVSQGSRVLLIMRSTRSDMSLTSAMSFVAAVKEMMRSDWRHADIDKLR